MKKLKVNTKQLKQILQHPLIVLSSILLLLVIGGLFYYGNISSILDEAGYSFEVKSQKETDNGVVYDTHPLTGKRCENNQQRPFAVMMPSDGPTRPLSGIAKADLVVEMPVVQTGITRMMAVFACEEPEEIGSIRSARDDFIPLAASFDAIYAHWGGSHFALDELKKGGVPDIDALVNPFNTYYRKSWIARPHNGFTSFGRLLSTSEALGFRTETNFSGYPSTKDRPTSDDNPITVSISSPYPYNTSYVYNPDKNSYMRWRAGIPETDAIDNKQVEVKTLVIMKTNTRPLEGQYNDVDVFGSGDALIFQNGELIRARWEKSHNNLGSKLFFYDEKNREVEFVGGNRWLQVIDKNTTVEWGGERI